MTAIRIKRCRLRIIRRRGWSWGTDRRELARQALRVLPEFLLNELKNRGIDGAEATITKPVCIVLSLSQLQLRLRSEAAREVLFKKTVAGHDARAAADRLESSTNSEAQDPGHPPDSVTLNRGTAPSTDLQSPEMVLLQLLGDWWERRELLERLALLSTVVLERWFDTLTSNAPPPPGQSEHQEITPAEIRKVVLSPEFAGRAKSTVRCTRDRIPTRPVQLQFQLAAFGALRQELGLQRLSPSVRAVVEECIPLEIDATVADGNASNEELLSTGKGKATPLESTGAEVRGTQSLISEDGPSTREDFDVHIPCALPFLLLGPLARSGYFQTLMAALAAADLKRECATFATALAHKSNPVPDMAWRRSEERETAAAAFAGLAVPLNESRIDRLASRAADFLPALNSVIATSVYHGREPDAPVLLKAVRSTRTEDWLLMDPTGHFPICRTNTWEEAISTLLLLSTTRQASARPDLVLIDSASSHPGILTRLNEVGVHFVTRARPTRRENWRELRRGPDSRWWTNDFDSPGRALIRHAARIPEADRLTGQAWQALADNSAAMEGTHHDFEAALSLAVIAGLAQISWVLYSQAETAEPLLARDRFEDLTARVKFRRDHVRVVLPLGRRSDHLAAEGLLSDIESVPWYGDRIVTFGRG